MYYQINTKQLNLLLFTQLLCTGFAMFLLTREQALVSSFAVSIEQMATLLLSILGSSLLLHAIKPRCLKAYLIGLNILGMACTFLILTYVFML